MKKPRLLVVDDEPINLSVVTRILEAEGYAVVAVPSGLEALKRCRAGDVAFDLVLLDVHMPILNGFETAVCLHGVPGLETVPIVFVSARATPADQEAGLAAGGRYYLTKPFRRKDLLEVVDRYMTGPRARPGAQEDIA